MLRKVAVGLAGLGLAAFAFAAPASAQNFFYNCTSGYDPLECPTGPAPIIDFEIWVDEIAVLNVTQPLGLMNVVTPLDNFMGNTDWPGGGEPLMPVDGDIANANGTFAQFQLLTNFPVSVQFSYPVVNNITAVLPYGIFAAGTWFGDATGDLGGKLGVWPEAFTTDVDGIKIVGPADTHNYTQAGSYPAPQLVLSPYALGTHYIALGVATNWRRTPTGDPAAPDTYTIPITATLMPAV